MNTVQKLLKIKGKQVWTISKGSTVFNGLKLMAQKQIGSLVVIEGSPVVGIFTERDFS